MEMIDQFMSKKTKKVVLLAFLANMIVACSSANFETKDGLAYKSANQVNALELPPELSKQHHQQQNMATNLKDYGRQSTTLYKTNQRTLLSSNQAKIVGSNLDAYLEVNADIDYVWSMLVKVFQEANLEFSMIDEKAGLIETKWMENHAEVSNDFIKNSIRKIGLGGIYSSPNRDMYRARLEPYANNKVHVYITNYKVNQKTSGKNENNSDNWQDRGSDPQLSGALLNRLLVKLIGSNGINTQNNNMMIIKETNNSIEIKRVFETLWAQIGDVFDDGSTFKVISQDLEKHSYTVEWKDPLKSKTRFKLFKSSPKPQQFKIALNKSLNNQTEIKILGLDNPEDLKLIKARIKNSLL